MVYYLYLVLTPFYIIDNGTKIRHINPDMDVLDALFAYKDPYTGKRLDEKPSIRINVGNIVNGYIHTIATVYNDLPKELVLEYIHNIKLFKCNFSHLALMASNTIETRVQT